MKTLQGMITQYFIMKDISNIHFISSLTNLNVLLKARNGARIKKERN